MNKKDQFWEKKLLSEMTGEEWESLCDGCGQCCLEKLIAGGTGRLMNIPVACRFLDIAACRCRVYTDRHRETKGRCLEVSPENIGELYWMPETCAYRRIADGKGLEPWHPLISGDPESVHEADVSVRGKVISGRHVHPDDLDSYRMLASES